MNRNIVFVIHFYISVLTCVCQGARGLNGAIIEIETIDPTVTNVRRGGGGSRREYQTVVNGQPVTIEVITDDQLKMFGQQNTNQQGNQYYWQQVQQQPNRYPNRNQQRPYPGNQPNIYITKDSSYPNIEVYDIYTDGGVSGNRYPNQNNRYPNIYPNGNVYPNRYPNQNGQNVYPNGNQNGQNVYPNGNIYPYPNQNGNRYPNIRPPNGQNNVYPYPNQNGHNSNNYPNINPNHNMHNNQNLPDDHGAVDNNNDNQEYINLSDLNNQGQHNQETKPHEHKVTTEKNNNQNKPNKNEQTHLPHGDNKDEKDNNIAGYIDNFPIILLNENEIRR